MRLPAAEIAAMRDVLTDHANARLTEIRGPGATDSRGRTGQGPVVWSGSVPAFLDRESRDELRQGVQVTVKVDTLTILDASGAPVSEIAGPSWTGTRITVEDRRLTPTVTSTFRVRDMAHEAAGILDGVKLELEGEA